MKVSGVQSCFEAKYLLCSQKKVIPVWKGMRVNNFELKYYFKHPCKNPSLLCKFLMWYEHHWISVDTYFVFEEQMKEHIKQEK